MNFKWNYCFAFLQDVLFPFRVSWYLCTPYFNLKQINSHTHQPSVIISFKNFWCVTKTNIIKSVARQTVPLTTSYTKIPHSIKFSNMKTISILCLLASTAQSFMIGSSTKRAASMLYNLVRAALSWWRFITLMFECCVGVLRDDYSCWCFRFANQLYTCRRFVPYQYIRDRARNDTDPPFMEVSRLNGLFELIRCLTSDTKILVFRGVWQRTHSLD